MKTSGRVPFSPKNLIKEISRKFGLEISRVKATPTVNLDDALLKFDIVKPFRQILDIGANVGQTALAFSRLFPKAEIHSIEPFSTSFTALKKICETVPNLHAYHLAIDRIVGEARLQINKESVTNSILAASQSAVDLLGDQVLGNVGFECVAVDTVERFWRNHAIGPIDLLKSDTQGYEDRILEGCGSLLNPDQIRLLMIEVLFFEHYESQADFGKIFSMVTQKGYKLYGLYNLHRTDLSGYMWADALFVPCDRVS